MLTLLSMFIYVMLSILRCVVKQQTGTRCFPHPSWLGLWKKTIISNKQFSLCFIGMYLIIENCFDYSRVSLFWQVNVWLLQDNEANLFRFPEFSCFGSFLLNLFLSRAPQSHSRLYESKPTVTKVIINSLKNDLSFITRNSADLKEEMSSSFFVWNEGKK